MMGENDDACGLGLGLKEEWWGRVLAVFWGVHIPVRCYGDA